jgi:myo-inositol-1-phosphate synthase
MVIDAVRRCKLALNPGLGGMLEGPAAHFMKSPSVRHSDERARQMLEELIAAPVPPTPVRDEAAPTSARGDDAGVGDILRPTVSPAGSLACCT